MIHSQFKKHFIEEVTANPAPR